ncbi:MAG: hypothetical protein U0573_09450 [Phycisphaerales bacterium]|nr:hypothetical protein [Planctomycetota bacterium]
MNGPIPEISVLEECETSRGWSYRVVALCGEGCELREFRITLSWVDHNYWCGGTQAPSATVERVVSELLSAISRDLADPRLVELPQKFDLSLARRLVPGIDAAVRHAG